MGATRYPLTPAFLAWFKGLPKDCRPFLLLERHPHVLHNLQGIWQRPHAVHQYFQELVLSDRVGRQGFSPEVLKEIHALQAHYDARFPAVPVDTWEAPRYGGPTPVAVPRSFADPGNPATWAII